LLEEICKSKAGKEKGATINWPAFGESPISEYVEKRVLCMLFPWLYPGWNGYFNDCRTVDISVKGWYRQWLFLAGDRLVKDNMWCFYDLKYAERRRNMTQGKLLLTICYITRKYHALIH
jgi:hypothetical protein